MNIVEAIAAMRGGKKVRRKCHIGTTIAKCWLSIGIEHLPTGNFDEDGDDERAPKEVIYFHAGAITERDNWVGTYPAIRNHWKPSQDDVLAEDFVVMN